MNKTRKLGFKAAKGLCNRFAIPLELYRMITCHQQASEMSTVQKLHAGSDSCFIAYRKFAPPKPSKDTGVVFFQGLMSNMKGTKANFLEKYCREMNLNYVCFDYMGHGDSSGKFEEFTIGLWKKNALDVLHNLTKGPQVFVGSSIGTWIMLLAALEMPERIHGLVGIAGAPDLLYQRYAILSNDDKDIIEKTGFLSLPSDYSKEPFKIPLQTIHEASEHLLLRESSIPINCPVRLIHGMKDSTVPYTLSITLSEKLSSNNVHLHLVKDGDHRLSKSKDLDLLANTLNSMIFQDSM